MENIDSQTGEITDFEIMENNGALVKQETAIVNYFGIAQEAFPDKAQKILTHTIDPNDIEIDPQGMVYLPQIKYRRILNNAFGVGAWAIRRLSIAHEGNTLMYDGELWVNGRYISGAIGEQEYIPTNKRMTKASAIEAAKSDCITRCCKDLGIASELWDPIFIKKWREEYAEEVWCIKDKSTDKKKLWRKKGDMQAIRWPWIVSSKNGKIQQPENKTETSNTVQAFPPCPKCGKYAIIKGRQEYGGGYLCFKKHDNKGCGAKFKTLDELQNPESSDIGDLIAKIHKVEQKAKEFNKTEQFFQTVEKTIGFKEYDKLDNLDEARKLWNAVKPKK